MKALAVAIFFGLVVMSGAQRTLTLVEPESTTDAMPTPETPKEATYWITFNTKIRPGQTMVFNVLILKGSSPVNVTASLLDSKRQNVIYQSDETPCTPGVVQAIPIEIPLHVERPSPSRWDNNYPVRVVGAGEVNFTKEGFVTLQEKAFSTFIQTDKAIYKPEQEVKFRVVSMDPQLQVMRDALYDIVIKDADNNRVLHHRNVNASADLGVVQSTFRLADIIPAGEWKIEVTIMGFKERKTFVVSDYVLPKFEVAFEAAPGFGLSDDAYLNFTVKAKYTFGEPVSDSNVTVQIKAMDYEWYYYRPGNSKPRPSVNLTAVLDRKGQHQFSVPIEKLVKLVQNYIKDKNDTEWQRFRINATVTEARTNKTQSAEHELQYFATPLKMEFLPITPNSYKAGLDFTAYLEVRKRNGSLFTPEEAGKIKVEFNVTYEVKRKKEISTTPPTRSSNSTGSITLEESARSDIGIMIDPYYHGTITKVLNISEDVRVQTLPDSGWLVIRFGIPSSATSFRIHAQTDAPYSRTDHAYFYGNPAHSPSESFLLLNVTNHKPKINDTVIVKAKATEVVKALFYQLSAKGILLHSKRVTPTTPSKEIEFEFPVESTMSPNLNVLAFFVREDGEFVVDALSLSVEGLFANSVDVKFSKTKVKPGETVDVVVKAKEKSMVFLLAVDKSVKLLKSGNDITQELVRQELLKYENGNNYGFWRYMFTCGWPSYNSGTDAASVFSSAGVQVLTDGLIYRRPYFFSDNDGVLESLPEAAATSSPGSAEERQKDTDTTDTEKSRSNFLEIMLWKAVTIPEQSAGEVRVNLLAPDTITSWVASAFSSHPTDGFSVGAEPAEVITFKDLFVSLDLPSFLVRGEEFCFTASIFYYYNMPFSVWVTMEKSSDFSGMFTKKENDGSIVTLKKEKLNYNVILGVMEEGDIKSTKFCITPEVLGIIVVRVSAKTNVAGLSDTVEHKLRVKPEGVPRSITKPYLVRLQNGQWSENVPIPFPPGTIPGSEKITINVAGNLLASVFENMDSLVKLPYGCGEQNMINFAPLVSLLKFFMVSDKLTPEREKKILDFMQIGYQRELTYKHQSTGGYSTFGDRTKDGPSTWLTAFVLKCFAQAHQLGVPFTDIDEITQSAIWLSKINRRGSFMEFGKVFNKRMQGGSGAGQALTAYSIIALHEAALAMGQDSNAYNTTILSRNKGIKYLEFTLPQLSDSYDVCITAYALHLVDSKLKDTIFQKMEQLAIHSAGLKYWERPQLKPTHRDYWTRTSDALSIEMTSYAYLTYNKRGIATTMGLDVINWLSQQKNANGGFISTQDTVIGIETFTEVLSKAQYITMSIRVKAGDETKTVDMKKENEMLLQRFGVPYESTTSNINLQAFATDSTENSTSTVLVEVALDFNVEEKCKSDVFQLEHVFVNNTLQLKVATINGETLGMTLIDIDLPSGYGVDEKSVEERNPEISKVEWKKPDVLSIYCQTDLIGPEGIKLTVPFTETNGVMLKSKDKNIVISTYYEPDTELSCSYIHDPLELCSSVKDFGHCPYQ